MHKRRTHEDVGMTKMYRDKGWFLSRYSYVSTKVHPNTERQCFYAAGQDCGKFRKAAIAIAKGRCQRCGMWTSQLEVHHIAHKTKMDRCWCPENLMVLCVGCHRGSRGMHVQVQWTRKQEAREQFNRLYPEEK